MSQIWVNMSQMQKYESISAPLILNFIIRMRCKINLGEQ